MSPELSLIAVFAIVVLLGGAAFGALMLIVISIHRTSRAPLSDVHNDAAGCISRRVLTGGRVPPGDPDA